jgi:hypothetical protein
MNTVQLTRNRTQQLVLNVEENKYQFFIELIKNFDFIQVAENLGDAKNDIVSNLADGFKQIKQIKTGKLKTRSVEEFLNEI